jgi:hypothetical protein
MVTWEPLIATLPEVTVAVSTRESFDAKKIENMPVVAVTVSEKLRTIFEVGPNPELLSEGVEEDIDGANASTLKFLLAPNDPVPPGAGSVRTTGAGVASSIVAPFRESALVDT